MYHYIVCMVYVYWAFTAFLSTATHFSSYLSCAFHNCLFLRKMHLNCCPLPIQVFKLQPLLTAIILFLKYVLPQLCFKTVIHSYFAILAFSLTNISHTGDKLCIKLQAICWWNHTTLWYLCRTYTEYFSYNY